MAKVEFKNQQLHLIGHVNFDNAQQVYQQGLQLLKSHQQWPVQIELSELEHGGTLVLAILLQWLRACPDQHSLQFKAVPNKMLGIIQASNLQQLLI